MRWVAVLLLLWPALGWGRETVRIGLFVGNNLGFGEDAPLAAPEREARDLARLFQAMGGLDRDRTKIILGADAPALDAAIRDVEAQVREASARGASVMLLFYYSGHASREGLHLRGTLLPMKRLETWLQQSTAQVRVAFVDACESGSLARTRGGTPVDAIELTVDDSLLSYGYAVITSAGPLSVARESDDYGGGVFSTALRLGLRGSADADESGGVTLEEAYNYVFEETVVSTARSGHGVQRPEYHTEMTGVGQVVLTRMTDREAGLVLAPELEGIYTVVSVVTGQVVARIDKRPGKDRRIALPSGRYVVRKVRRSDVLVAELDVAWGGDRWVDDAQLTSVPLGDPLSRGSGAFDRPIRLSVAGLGASPSASSNPLTAGVQVGLRVRSPRAPIGVAAAAQFVTGRKVGSRGRLDTTTGLAFLGVFGQRHFRKLDLVLGGGVSGLRIHQELRVEVGDRPWFDDDATQFVAGPYGEAALHIPVGPAVGIATGLRGLVYPVRTVDQTSFFVMGQAYAGLEVRFGGRIRRTLPRTRTSEESPTP